SAATPGAATCPRTPTNAPTPINSRSQRKQPPCPRNGGRPPHHSGDEQVAVLRRAAEQVQVPDVEEVERSCRVSNAHGGLPVHPAGSAEVPVTPEAYPANEKKGRTRTFGVAGCSEAHSDPCGCVLRARERPGRRANRGAVRVHRWSR